MLLAALRGKQGSRVPGNQDWVTGPTGLRASGPPDRRGPRANGSSRPRAAGRRAVAGRGPAFSKIICQRFHNLVTKKGSCQEGEVNTSDLPDPMIQPRSQGTLSTSGKYPGCGWSRVYVNKSNPHRGWIIDLILSTLSMEVRVALPLYLES